MVQLSADRIQAAVAAASDPFCTWTAFQALRDTWNANDHGPYDQTFIGGQKFTVGRTYPDIGPPPDPTKYPPKPCSHDPFSSIIPILVFGGAAASFIAPLVGGGAAAAPGAAVDTAAPAVSVPGSASLSLPSLGGIAKGGIAGLAGLAKNLGFPSGTGSGMSTLDDILSTANGGQLPDWLQQVEGVAGDIFGSPDQGGPSNPPPRAQPMTSTLGWIVPVAIVGIILAVAFSARR